MKKFIYPCIPFVLVVLFVTVLGACNSAVPRDRVSITDGTTEPVVIKRYSGQAIRKLEFEGHHYLVLNNNGGICHDENCKCKK